MVSGHDSRPRIGIRAADTDLLLRHKLGGSRKRAVPWLGKWQFALSFCPVSCFNALWGKDGVSR